MSEAPPSIPEPKEASTLWAPLRFLTSLQLCVVILILCALGIFLGTIAQVHEGLYLAQERWFKSWFILRQPGDDWWVWFYPGGYLLGVLLIVNLTGAHLRRFKFPPGGLGIMLAHYLVVIAALYGATAYLSWGIAHRETLIPFYFFMVVTAILVVDMVLSAPANNNKLLIATGRKIGVDMVHVGILVLLIGQLATDMLAKETHMSFREGQTMNYSEDRFDTELVIAQDIPGDPMNDKVVSIPQALIVKDEERIDKEVSPSGVPITVRLKSWEPNHELVDLREAARHEATLRQALATLESRYAQPDTLADGAREAMESAGRTEIWKQALAKSGVAPGPNLTDDVEKVLKDTAKATELLKNLRESFRGVMIGQFRDGQNPNMRYAANHVLRDPESKEPPPEPQASCPVAQNYRAVPLKVSRDMESRNVPSGIVEVSGPSGKLGTWLVSPFLKEQVIDCGQTTARISLRMERTYYPFTVKLLKTTNTVYPGTEIPKDFRSQLLLEYPAKNESRETEVFMNAPLRYEGLTFFQYQMGKDEMDRNVGTSSLQVVKNPASISPYFGCALVSYGMLRHFILHLLRFINKRKKA